MTNTGGKPIEAYVLVNDADDRKDTHITIGHDKTARAETSVFENADKFMKGKFTLSDDYIQFSDGTTWGSDECGRSKYVNAYLAGRNLAISRLKEMLGGLIPDDLQKALDASGGHGSDEPFTGNRPDRSHEMTLYGYQEVIAVLRRSTIRTEGAQDLARKLEPMENTLKLN